MPGAALPPSPRRRLYLDLLPPELHLLIATFVHRDDLTAHPRTFNSTLSLAQATPSFLSATRTNLNHSLTLPLPSAPRFAALLHPTITHFSTPHPHAHRDNIIHLLKAPTLTHATIPNSRPCLETVSRSPALTHLTLTLSYPTPPSIPLLTLNHLPRLVSLHLKCHHHCTFTHALPTREHWHHLSTLLPSLAAIHLSCICTAKPLHLAPLLSKFPHLSHVSFNRPAHPRSLPFLRTLPAISLKHLCNSPLPTAPQLQLAAAIANPIIALTSSYFPMPSKNSLILAPALSHLARCPRLQALDLHLAPGAELQLPHLPDLRSLRIRWLHPMSYDASHPFHQPSHKFFTRLLQLVPSLHTLALFHVAIPKHVLHDLLQRAATHLRTFGTSIAGQVQESPLQRLLLLVEAVTRFNRALNKLDVFGHPPLETADVSRDRVMATIRLMRTRVPALDVKELLDYVHRYLRVDE